MSVEALEAAKSALRAVDRESNLTPMSESLVNTSLSLVEEALEEVYKEDPSKGFDLQFAIRDTWSVVDELHVVLYKLNELSDALEPEDMDVLVNIINGIIDMQEIRVNRALNIFEEMKHV